MDNLLPYDGQVTYIPHFMEGAEAEALFHILLEAVPWEHDVLHLFGKTITTERKVAWYGDPSAVYRYSGSTKKPFPWTQDLLRLKHAVEQLSGGRLNACLLNLYHHAGEGMSWHSDNEAELGPHPLIVSISLGAERRFSFKHKIKGTRIDILLESGSALLMAGSTQQHWLHALPKSKASPTTLFGTPQERINLTFRLIV